jgi:hypothetical protein
MGRFTLHPSACTQNKDSKKPAFISKFQTTHCNRYRSIANRNRIFNQVCKVIYNRNIIRTVVYSIYLPSVCAYRNTSWVYACSYFRNHIVCNGAKRNNYVASTPLTHFYFMEMPPPGVSQKSNIDHIFKKNGPFYTSPSSSLGFG